MHSWAYKKVRKLPERKGVLQMRVVSVPAAQCPLCGCCSRSLLEAWVSSLMRKRRKKLWACERRRIEWRLSPSCPRKVTGRLFILTWFLEGQGKRCRLRILNRLSLHGSGDSGCMSIRPGHRYPLAIWRHKTKHCCKETFLHLRHVGYPNVKPHWRWARNLKLPVTWVNSWLWARV